MNTQFMDNLFEVPINNIWKNLLNICPKTLGNILTIQVFFFTARLRKIKLYFETYSSYLKYVIMLSYERNEVRYSSHLFIKQEKTPFIYKIVVIISTNQYCSEALKNRQWQ